MTSAPTGSFLRGETVTQATSGAEGEFLGYDFDSAGAQGHAVILPRTGTFDASHVITGSSSGATFTPSGLKTFVMEIVFWKTTNTTQGSIYLQRVSVEDESASRFSTLAQGAAGCTAAVAPGGGGTGNSFPTAGSYVGCGSQISNTITHSNWFQTATNLGRAQITATNCAGSSGVSADGTFWILMGDVTTSTQAQFLSYMRMDSGEDADLDPFIWIRCSGVGYNNANIRVDATGISSLNSSTVFCGSAPSTVAWRGWRRRGFSSNDGFVPLTVSGLAYFGTSSATLPVTADNPSNPETVACAYTSKRVREQILVSSADNTKKIRKGYPRWMWILMGGTTFDTWDAKTKVCIVPALTSNPYTPSVIVGPYDGSSTPLQASS
ncbi:hypothetical protein A7982_12111 [Minicystis rosea]|nr:hypothetical protein A7982_12111 [Minicystis rosea]